MPISVQCMGCGKTHKLANEHAGKQGKCRDCGSVLTIPEPEITEGGAEVLRHEMPEPSSELSFGDSDAIDEISDHIEAYVGPVETVFHELVSPLVHIDVHFVAPTKERPFSTLVTSGMSERPMTVPEGAEALRYAELMIALPPDWPMTEESFKDERYYWPIRLLKMLARMPHEFDTWLGFGHTVPNDEPYAPNTKLMCAMLMVPLTLPEGFYQLQMQDGRTVNFYAVFPLYEREMEFKLKHGLDPLIDRFEKHRVSEILDVRRANTCRKKFLGLL